MNIFNAIILGIVQGLTEFLPVSSSGHLVIVQSFFDSFNQVGVLFDTILHAGTTLAVLFYFRDKLRKLKFDYIILIIIGSIPAAIVGALLSDLIESLFSSVMIVGVALLFTALLNYLTDKADARRENIGRVDALIVGLMQAVAIIPGVSRSGSTIFAGTSMGLSRETAAEYSFLMSVPVIIGANIIQIYKYGIGDGTGIFVYVAGFTTAFVSGVIAISLVLRLLGEKNFKYFSIYCVVLGLLAIFVL